MTVVAVHTRLIEGTEAAYDRLHRTIPLELARDLTGAGVTDWSIWRSGTDLFHSIDVNDRAQMRALMRQSAANRDWQQRVAPLLAAPPFAGDLPLVWNLRAQLS